MKTSSKSARLLALGLALNAGAFVALNAAEPVKTVSAAKPTAAADAVNDGDCSCDEDEDGTSTAKVAEKSPTTSTTVNTTVASPDKSAAKKQAKVSVSTSTHMSTSSDGKSVKETTHAKYVNGELVSGGTTRTSGNDAAAMARPIEPSASTTPETK